MIFAHWCVTRHSHFPLSRELKTWLGKPTPKQTFFRKMTFWMHYFWMRNKLIKAIKFLCPLIISTSPLSAAEKYSRVKFLLAANCRMTRFHWQLFACCGRCRLVCPLRTLVSRFQRGYLLLLSNNYSWL